MKPSIVFLGNALANALHHVWCGCVIGSDSYDSASVHYMNVSESDVDRLRTADVIILQVSDIEGIDIAAMGTRAKIVRFPYVNGSFLWPYAGHTHPRWGETEMHTCGVFAGECGDGFLEKLYRKGVPAQDAVAAYAELDILKTAKIERRFEVCLAMQRQRDQRAAFDVSIADYIADNIGERVLFVSRQNLAKPLFWHLTRIVFAQVLKELGDCERKVAQAELLHHVHLWGLLEMPIHPKIGDHFRIPGLSSNYKFRVNRSRLTFDEYSRDYMNDIYQVDIFEGIRLLDDCQYEAAEARLTRGLQLAPGSPDAAAAMSKLLSGLGRSQEALEFSCASVHLDTDSQHNLRFLAERYLDLGWHSAARAALERSLEIHFFDWSSHHMLLDLYLRNDDMTAALSLARRVANGLPDHHSAQFRLGHLLLQCGMFAEAQHALASLRAAAAASPRDGNAHAHIGHLLWGMGRMAEAKDSFGKAIELAPEREDLREAYSTILMHASGS